MSASIYAEPVERKKDYIPIGAPSSFMDALDKVFGERLPCLQESDVPKLRVIFVLGNYDTKALEILTRLITDHGAIQLSAKY